MEQERSLDPQLWQACAGSMVQIPSLNSTVFYFPQGHAEHAHAPPDFHAPRVPPLILCRVASVKFLADAETDEVYSKITLLPLPGNDLDLENDAVLGLTPSPDVNGNEKPASFAKTLTQSDANNGGGFSVPRYCAETIFPRLDYTAEPPVQTVIAKDIHGKTWKFRHIYRGTPRRHLLTTGWSTFVNQKKLIAGDSIVFLRSETGDLCVGIRRAKRGGLGSNGDNNSNSNNPYPGFSGFLRDDEITTSKLMMMKRNATGGGGNANDANAPGGRVRVEAVAEAVARAACGQAFEVVYYPRASTPEFCVKASDVRSAMRIRWCSGMRFKMAFETEDSSRISWFMGTVSAVQVADPIRWPNSPWRLLQVAWDEPDLLQNVKRVSPWLVELVSNMPAIHLSPFSPRKKLRIPQPFDFPFDGTKFPMFSPGFAAGNNGGGESMCYLSNNDNNNNNAPAGIQGARQAQQLFGSPSPSLLSDLNLNTFHSGNKLQQSSSSPAMFLSGFNPRHHYDNIVLPRQTRDAEFNNNISCSLTIGNPGLAQDKKKSDSVKTHQFLLFGQPILTEQQVMNRKRALEEEAEKEEKGGLTWNYGLQGLETGHCKVFMESEDVGRTLDLSVIGSYQELYRKLAEMFGIEERSDLLTHVVYRDANGVTKRIGDEPFSDFMRATKRLTIKMDISGDNVRKTWITGIRNGENGIDSSTKTGQLSIFA